MMTTPNDSTELDTISTEPKRNRLDEMRVDRRGVRLETLADYWTFANAVCRAGMSPKLGKDQYMTPQQVMLAMQLGAEVGLPPMTALKNITVINNRPTIWGDALLALAFRMNLIEEIDEQVTGEGDQRTAICIIKRRGMETPVVRTFSVADAKQAGLWSKPGPWQQYPDVMLGHRARGFCISAAAPEAKGGFDIAEEVMDIPVGEDEVITRSEALLRDLGSDAAEATGTSLAEASEEGGSDA